VHDIRHPFASKLVIAGVDVNTVRESFGHADIGMTLRYAHLALQHKAAAVERFVRRGRASMQQIEINSLAEYVDAVIKNFGTKFAPMFRGVKNADEHKLIPTGGRLYQRRFGPQKVPIEEYTQHVAAKMQHFADKMIVHAAVHTKHPIEMWALAQHHGFPTMLLDWSLNPLVALFFALDERYECTPTNKRATAGVYAIRGEIAMFRPEATKPAVDPDKTKDVFAYAPRHLHPRISAQSGVFTYHPDITAEYSPEDLVQFRVPAKMRRDVFVQLGVFGVTSHFVYQDFDGLGEMLRQMLGGWTD
jgi:hypothetical protein